MEQYKIDTNESFFKRLLFLLKEGGTWVWAEKAQIFTKKGDKLIGTPESLEEISKIVSKQFFRRHFTLVTPDNEVKADRDIPGLGMS